MEIRPLTPDELDDPAVLPPLRSEAFGPPAPSAPPAPALSELPPQRHTWGVFDGPRLVASMAALELSSWYGGRALPTCGIANVAVAAEHRGRGLLAGLLEEVLHEAAARGAALSTLFATAPGIYRSLGYETICSYDTVRLAVPELARVRPPESVRTRRATTDDASGIAAVYAAWAAAQNGPLTRTGPRFPDHRWTLERTAAVTVALDADARVVGFAAWDRSGGYRGDGCLEVRDLIATTADGYRALWSVLASFASVAGSVRLISSGSDPARTVLPTSSWESVEQYPYSLRVLDVAATLSALGPAPAGYDAAPLTFSVSGDRLGRLDGTYAWTTDGAGCTRVADRDDTPTLTPQGLSLALAGVQSCANLRMLDHLHGPADQDTTLDAALGGRPVHIRDYF